MSMFRNLGLLFARPAPAQTPGMKEARNKVIDREAQRVRAAKVDLTASANTIISEANRIKQLIDDWQHGEHQDAGAQHSGDQ